MSELHRKLLKDFETQPPEMGGMILKEPIECCLNCHFLWVSSRATHGTVQSSEWLSAYPKERLAMGKIKYEMPASMMMRCNAGCWKEAFYNNQGENIRLSANRLGLCFFLYYYLVSLDMAPETALKLEHRLRDNDIYEKQMEIQNINMDLAAKNDTYSKEMKTLGTIGLKTSKIAAIAAVIAAVITLCTAIQGCL